MTRLTRLLNFFAGLLALAVLVVLLVFAFGTIESPTTAQGESNRTPTEAPQTSPQSEATKLVPVATPELAALSSPTVVPTDTPTKAPSPSPMLATPTTAILALWRAENIEVASPKAIEMHGELRSQPRQLIVSEVSPDGNRVLFERYTGKIPCEEGSETGTLPSAASETCFYPEAELWLYSLADSTWLRLDGPATQGSFSPDGQAIAYLAQVGPSKYDLRVLMAEGGEPQTIVLDVKWSKPNWRSAEEIVYLSRDGAISQINLTDSSTEELSPIKIEKFSGPVTFVLAGDGGTLAVVKERDVWLVPLDREQEPQVLSGPDEYLSFSNIIGGMAWSRDGGYLAMAAGTGYITIFDREGRFISAPSMGGQAIYELSWSPDGSSVAALSHRRTQNAAGFMVDIVIANTDGEVVKKLGLTEDQKYTMDWSPSGFIVWTNEFQQVPFLLEMTLR